MPASSAVVTSPAMSWPMLSGTLPPTSLTGFRLSSAGLYVTTWAELAVWLKQAYAQWNTDARLQLQADVAAETSDPTLPHQLNVMEHRAFARLVSGETPVKTKHSLGQLYLWYAVYCCAARNRGQLPLHTLQTIDNERVVPYPLTRDEWKKLITATLPNFRMIPSLKDAAPSSNRDEGAGASKLWKSMIFTSRQGPTHANDALKLHEAFEDVLHIPVTAVPVAASSLRQMRVNPKVGASTLRALEACRQPQQLHAAAKLVWRKLTAAVQAAVHADFLEWSSMCAEAVPTAPTAADRLQFLRTCHHNIGNAPQATDWIAVALDLSTQLPNAIDPSPIVDVQCARTFRAALLTSSKKEDLSRDHVRQASKAVQQVLRTGDNAPADEPSYDWFLDPAAVAHIGPPPRASAAESAVQAAPATPVPPTMVHITRPGTPTAPLACLPVGTVVSSQPAVPPDARVLRANNLHRERTAEEYNEILLGTLQPLTQFSVTDVARGFGHIYVTAEIFNKYYSTVDSVDI